MPSRRHFAVAFALSLAAPLALGAQEASLVYRLGKDTVAIEQFTLNTFQWFFHSGKPEAQRTLTQLQTALHAADDKVLEESAGHPELTGMGTTLTLAYHLDAQLCVVHVGDSRAYIFKHDQLRQITHDHSITANMVRRGEIARRRGAVTPAGTRLALDSGFTAGVPERVPA